jgi:dethiobiotin synthetase
LKEPAFILKTAKLVLRIKGKEFYCEAIVRKTNFLILKTMQQHFFITGIGTDIGKSFILSIIAKHWLRHGRQVAICKPIMSGVESWQNNDTATLLQAINITPTEASIRQISPWIFTAALSPHRAAELADQHIDFSKLVTWCKNWLIQNHDAHALIEGAGGVAVPINYQHHITDLIKTLQLPVIFIASDYLGAISHSLTGLHFLQQAGVEVAAIIVNQHQASIDHDATCATIAQFSPYNNALVLSFKQADEAAKNQWNNDEKWRFSKIWQQNQPFFEFFST